MFSLVTPPATEPIPLADLKAALRIDNTDEDAVINLMAITARTFIERRLDRAFLLQSWALTLDHVPLGPISLRPGIVNSITNVTATYGEGSPQSIGSEDWCLSRREPAQFSLDIPSQVGGETLSELVVTFTAGETSASDIPADLIRALYLLTAHYYEQREAFQEQRYVAVPLTVEALLNSYREIRL